MRTAYHFPVPLKKGIIRNRPNRFVMHVEFKGKLLRCRCPSPTKIGKIKFSATPCLLSANSVGGTTTHTVEAIGIKDVTGHRHWVGINQTRINDICRYFIKAGMLNKLTHGEPLTKGKRIGKSVIDFASPKTILEIKAPLTVLPSFGKKTANYAHQGDYERTIRHCRLLTQQAKIGKRAILLLAYLYLAPEFNPLRQNATNQRFITCISKAALSGVEFWQANFLFSKTGVQLGRCCKLRLATGKPNE